MLNRMASVFISFFVDKYTLVRTVTRNGNTLNIAIANDRSQSNDHIRCTIFCLNRVDRDIVHPTNAISEDLSSGDCIHIFWNEKC